MTKNCSRPEFAICLALLAMVPVQAVAEPSGGQGGLVALSELYAERSLVLYSDERCALLSSAAHDALAASLSQLRGTLLRAGAHGGALSEADGVLKAEADAKDCHDRDLKQTARDVSEFHLHYLRVRQLSFPAFGTHWAADRAERSRYDGWPLVQSFGTPGDDARIGLTSGADQTRLSVRVPRSLGAVQTVKLGVQNDSARRQAQRRADDEPHERDRPWTILSREADMIFALNRRTETLEDGSEATVFDFPASAISALSASDPRASFVVVFNVISSVGQVGSRLYSLPIGDFFAAAHFAVNEPAKGGMAGASR
jgi:hypothetical protein